MAKRTLNRMDLRADYEAAERKKREEEEVEEEEGEDEEEEDEEEGGDEEPAAEEEGEEDEDEEEEEYDEDGEPIRKKKKKKKKEPVKTAKPKRVRVGKVPRMRVVWWVCDNSNRQITGGRYDYPRRAEADEHAARLTAEKKQTFFVQAVKEPMEEKPA